MARWLGQWDDFRCGPIALVNVLKWLGLKYFRGRRVNKKLAKGYMTELCKTDRQGTFEQDFEAVLYSIPGLKIQKRLRPTRQEIKSRLKKGYIVILDSPWWNKKKCKHEWHYCLIINVLARGFLYRVVNNMEGSTFGYITSGKLGKMLRHGNTAAYYLRKEDS